MPRPGAVPARGLASQTTIVKQLGRTQTYVRIRGSVGKDGATGAPHPREKGRAMTIEELYGKVMADDALKESLAQAAKDGYSGPDFLDS